MAGAVYCTTSDVIRRLIGAGLEMEAAYVGVLASKIPEVCADIDRRVRQARGQPQGWSFLAAAAHEVQLVSIAGEPGGGDFTLSLGATTSGAIAFDADSSGVQSVLDAAFGAGAIVCAPAGDGGPWQLTFAADGPQLLLVPVASFTDDAQPTPSYVYVERLVPGAVLPAVRTYAGSGTVLQFIDDCTSVASVTVTDRAGTVIETPDWLPFPLGGAPILGLERQDGGRWAEGTLVVVELVPGYADELLPDVVEAAEIETIRSYFGDRTGQDDRLGMTPFGTLSVAKAFTSKLGSLVADYSEASRLFAR